MRPLVRPELPTASVDLSQVPTAAVNNPATFPTRPQSTYRSGITVQTNGATSVNVIWQGRRCLVTGGAGFIGGALCRELALRGARVFRATRRPPVGPEVNDWRTCDVALSGEVNDAFGWAQPQIVFHLASTVTGSRKRELVLQTLRDNLIGTVNVLEAASERGNVRVICLGSLQEPDDIALGVPSSPYAAAKFAASAYARMYASVYELSVTIARTFMVYGPGQLDFSKLVPYVVSELLCGRAARLSSGEQGFDWIFVDDVVDALLAIAISDSAIGATVDVGSGSLISVREIAEALASRLGALGKLEFGAVPSRRFEPTRTADVEATAGLVGWRARVPIDVGLDRTVAWYRDRRSEGGGPY